MAKRSIRKRYCTNACVCRGAMSVCDPTACRNNDMRYWILDDGTLNVDAPMWKRHPWGDLVDPIAAQLAWWLPAPTPHALPGNARREPVAIEMARAASEVEREIFERVEKKTGDVVALRNLASDLRDAVGVDVEHLRRSAWTDDLRQRVWRYTDHEARAWARREQARTERRLWMRRTTAEVVGFQYPDGRRVLADSVTLNVETESVPASGTVVNGFSIGWAQPSARVKSIESNLLEIERDDDVQRLPRPTPTNREAGRNFLLSKQRRSERGPR